MDKRKRRMTAAAACQCVDRLFRMDGGALINEQTANGTNRAMIHALEHGYMLSTKMTVTPENLPYLADGCGFLFRHMKALFCNCALEPNWQVEHARELFEQLKSLTERLLPDPVFCRKSCTLLGRRIGSGTPGLDRENYCGGIRAMIAFGTDGLFDKVVSMIGYFSFGYQPDYLLPDIDDEAAMARLTGRYGANASKIAKTFQEAYPDHDLAEALFINSRVTSAPRCRNGLIVFWFNKEAERTWRPLRFLL